MDRHSSTGRLTAGVFDVSGSSPSNHTVKDWVDALQRSGWKGRKVGKEWNGPCPCCGGTDRFHVGPGSKAEVVAGCRKGCSFEDLVRAVFGGPSPRPGRPSWDRHGASRRSTQRSSQPESSSVATPGADKGTATDDGGCPRCGGQVKIDSASGKPERCRVCRARGWWDALSWPVPGDDTSAARRWAAHRKLWRANQPFPESIRCAEKGEGTSLIVAFAPVRDWVEAAGSVPQLSGVQLIHVDADGRPRKDGGGLDKRSLGTFAGAVTVMGTPIASATRVNVVEGVADALAVAARKDGTVVATGGTAGMKNVRIASELAGLRLPVYVWPDGERAGREAAEQLAAAIRDHGGSAAVMPMPDGEDPASLGRRLHDINEPDATAPGDPDEAVEPSADPLAHDVEDLVGAVRSHGWTKENRDTFNTLWGDIQARKMQEAHDALESLEAGASIEDTLNVLRKDLETTVATDPRLLGDSLRACTDWTGEPEPRKWLCPEWLPAGRVAMLTGPGGGAKSLLALQLAVVVASGCSARSPSMKGRAVVPDARGEGKGAQGGLRSGSRGVCDVGRRASGGSPETGGDSEPRA